MTISGIFPPYEAFYISSMQFNCHSAIRSMLRVSKAVEQYSPGADIDAVSMRNFLDELQNIVTQGAALSRYFWPIRKGHEARASYLRNAFSISESSSLHSRNLRNAIEHFDERLDNYLSTGIVGYIIPEFVGTQPIESEVPGHFFRAYFINVGIFRLLDEEYPIEPLANEILRISDLLEQFSLQGERIGFPR